MTTRDFIDRHHARLESPSLGIGLGLMLGTVSSGGGGAPSPLVASTGFPIGIPINGILTGGTFGSTVVSNIPGITVDGTNRAYSGTPTGSAATYANGFVETGGLPGYANISASTFAVPTYASVSGFGDSMTAGTAATTAGNRFINLIVAATGAGTLRNMGIGSTVLQNSNDAGGTPRTDNGRDRFVADLLGANQSEAVFLAYGWNDMRYIGAPGTFNVAAFINDYSEVISGLIIGGYDRNKITINTPFWVTDDILANAVTPGMSPTSRSWVLAYIAACKQIAASFGIRFADVYTPTINRTDLIDGDGVHPNNAGHLLYKNILLASYVPNALPLPASTALATPGSGALNLTWTAPAGTITSYTAELAIVGTYVFGNAKTGAGLSASWTGLADGAYRGRVRANFADGTVSPWSFSSNTITLGLGTIFAQTASFAAVSDDTLLNATTPTLGAWATMYSRANALIKGQRITQGAAAATSVEQIATQSLTGLTIIGEGVLDVKSNVSGLSAAICLRMHATNESMVSFGYNNGDFSINKWLVGSPTALATIVNNPLSVGEHTIRAEISVGSQKLYCDGVLIMSAAVADGGGGLTGLGQGVGIRQAGAITGSAGPTWKSLTYGYV